MKLEVTDPELFSLFINPNTWRPNYRGMSCDTHGENPRFTVRGENPDSGEQTFNVSIDACCVEFFNEILNKARLHIECQKQRKELVQFFKDRAENTEIVETLLVNGEEILETEITDLWNDSATGNYLETTGGWKVYVPANEVQRVRDFLEHRNDVIGIRRKLTIGGQVLYDDEVLELVENDTVLKLKDGRLINFNPLEVDALRYLVIRNKKLRGEE